jgi:hypothetical protein
MRIVRLFVASLTAIGLWASDAGAYPQYVDPATDTGYCTTCHGRFTDGTSPKGSIFPDGGKHFSLHWNMLASFGEPCLLCHILPGADDPFIGFSSGTSNNTGYGCMGCHGRLEDAGHDLLSAGLGAGLRQRHTVVGITGCMGCHTDADPKDYTPVGEGVKPPYYGTADLSNVADPCNLVAVADTNENWTAESPPQFEGLDNDGDNLYDGNDPDCGGPTTTTTTIPSTTSTTAVSTTTTTTTAIPTTTTTTLPPQPVDPVGICGRHHEGPRDLFLQAQGKHGEQLTCKSCHPDRRGVRTFSRGHRRKIIPCTTCHEDEKGRHHPPRTEAKLERKSGRRISRNCLRCHTPHGSTNLSLIRTRVRAGRKRTKGIQFDNKSGAADGSFASDPTAPGKGLCEVCHRKTQFYRRNGRGESHFSASCVSCHNHLAGFEPVVADQNCTICHTDEGTRFGKPSLHSANFTECSGCHDKISPTPGPGHRRRPDCTECHDTIATHVPPGVSAFPCVQCHNPHGTDNIKLVSGTITTPGGQQRPVNFDNESGQRDGSFASVSEPGTGVCEICHTTTRYFRADGTGDPHWVSSITPTTPSCVACHRHPRGFMAPNP